MKIRQRELWAAVFALLLVYMAALCYMLFLSEAFGRGCIPEEYSRLNLMPFQEIRRFITQRAKIGLLSVLLNTAGNVIGFIPMGILYPLLFAKINRWYKMALAGGAFSLLVETLQYVCRVGIFDVDDLLLNTIGTIAGYAVAVGIYRMGITGGKAR